MDPEPSNTTEALRDRYVTLLRRALTRHEMETATWYTPIHSEHAPRRIRPILDFGQRTLRRASLELVRRRAPNPEARLGGTDWPQSAETMVGLKRLDNLHDCLRQIFADDVPGDILEAGVWRGGASIFMRGISVAYGQTDRHLWVADSFAGLPAPSDRYKWDEASVLHSFDELAVSLQEVQANFIKYDLLDDHVHFLKGWFEDTLPTAPINQLALLRLDGDMYSSTVHTLNALYDKVSPKGFIVVDDYLRLPQCRAATDEFRTKLGIVDTIVPIDDDGIFWRKTG